MSVNQELILEGLNTFDRNLSAEALKIIHQRSVFLVCENGDFFPIIRYKRFNKNEIELFFDCFEYYSYFELLISKINLKNNFFIILPDFCHKVRQFLDINFYDNIFSVYLNFEL